MWRILQYTCKCWPFPRHERYNSASEAAYMIIHLHWLETSSDVTTQDYERYSMGLRLQSRAQEYILVWSRIVIQSLLSSFRWGRISSSTGVVSMWWYMSFVFHVGEGFSWTAMFTVRNFRRKTSSLGSSDLISSNSRNTLHSLISCRYIGVCAVLGGHGIGSDMSIYA